jgi:hypothetical protein
MAIAVIPLLAWCVHNTSISIRDVFSVISRPLASICIASVLAYGAKVFWGESLVVWLRLFLELAVLFLIYAAFLVFVVGEKNLYIDIIRGLRGSAASPKNAAST